MNDNYLILVISVVLSVFVAMNICERNGCMENDRYFFMCMQFGFPALVILSVLSQKDVKMFDIFLCSLGSAVLATNLCVYQKRNQLSTV